MTFHLLLKEKIKKSTSSKLKYTVLSVDPGTVSFGYCATTNNKVIYGSMLKNPINIISDTAIDAFTDEFCILLDTYKPNVVVIERFIIRRFLSKLAEFVGIMVGIMRHECRIRGIKSVLISAAQWKNSIKKILDLKCLYKQAKKEFKIPPHPIDSLCTTRYHLSNNNYKSEDKQWIMKNLSKLIKQA